MLEYLHIQNLALIEDVRLELGSGLNALTGETGAGKSFILKALSFLLGDRLKADMVRPGAERAIVEGLFQTSSGELILRRELLAESGRSRIYVNNVLHGQDSLKELRQSLITYTSQHAQQQLMQPSFQARLIEQNFPRPELLQERDRLVQELREIAEKQKVLEEKRQNLLEKRDLLEMQQAEIEKVSPQEGEEERLEEQRKTLRDRQQIAKSYEAILTTLYSHDPPGLVAGLNTLERQLGQLTVLDESLTEYLNSCLDFRVNLEALAERMQSPLGEEGDFDADALEARLYALAQLKRKLHRSLPEILALKQELSASLSFLDSCSLDLSHLAKEEAALTERLSNVVKEIIPLRRETANDFCSHLEAQLRDLAFSEQVKVIPDYQAVILWKEVQDERIRFLWAPNPGQKPKPLDHIASGGELSRFLLALTSLQTRDDQSTYIFDEVDSGVGGYTLLKLADKLVELAKNHQLILITHWPQLASLAEHHFQIIKQIDGESTSTTCRLLSKEERREELARMAGGGELGKVYSG